MALKTPQDLSQESTSHGIRPFSYRVEFATDPANPGQPINPKSPTLVWKQRLTKLQTVSLAYGSGSEQHADFSTWDQSSVPTNFPDMNLLVTPQNGDVLRIWVDDGMQDPVWPKKTTIDPQTGDAVPSGTQLTERLIFKGTVRNVVEDNTNAGITYTASARSEATRLDEVYYNGKFNLYDEDPTQAQPRFDGDGRVDTKQYTIVQIISSIMSFQDTWQTTEYFQFSDIDWQGLDTEPRCGLWVPRKVELGNVTKGQAILNVLQMAGNFTYLYDPLNDKIRIIELNGQCKGCGNEWLIKFASTEQNLSAFGRMLEGNTNQTPYAYDYTVEHDRTTWASEDAFNVVRVLSDQIHFYSGNYCIPEMISADNSATIDQDTADMQKARARNPDNCYYRFVNPATGLTVSDVRNVKQFFVGRPLFPDWNIFEDWLPAVFEIGDVILPPAWFAAGGSQTTGPAASAYSTRAEFQPFTIGHQCTQKFPHLAHLDNLRAYQVWHADAACPACRGQGLVQSIYNGNNNEPNITIVNKGAEGQQRPSIEVTNHLMPPSFFGQINVFPTTVTMPDNSTQVINAGNVFGLQPFYDIVDGTPNTADPVVALTHGYPLPWKNTCPFCRGVGMWPKYKIRNIDKQLVSGRVLTVVPTGTITDIPADPDLTQSGPESWEDANNRISVSAGVQIQVETPVMGSFCLPEFSCRDYPYNTDPNHTVAAFTLGGLSDGSTPNTPNNKRWNFPHPLQLQNTQKQLCPGGAAGTGLTGVTVSVGDAGHRDHLVPDSWACRVPFTTISMQAPIQPDIDYKMGRVLFKDEPIFIPCWMDYSMIQTTNQKARVDTTGLLLVGAPARGYETSDNRGMPVGYWRPARVWMHFEYVRDKYYNSCQKAPGGNTIDTTTFQADPFHIPGTPPSTGLLLKNYQARSMIMDGKYALEVMLQTTGTPARIICKSVEDPQYKIELFESDFWLMTTAPNADLPDSPAEAATANLPVGSDFETLKTNADYQFVNARLVRWMRTTPGEAIVEMEGYADADHYGSVLRPKVLKWQPRDDRSAMLGYAIRTLGLVNNIQVKGELTLVGPTNDLTYGLGWVNYPGKGLAAVSCVTYNFGTGFTTALELFRAETRIGTLPVKDADRQDKVETEVARLKKVIDLNRQIDAERRPGGSEQVVNQSTISSIITGGA